MIKQIMKAFIIWGLNERGDPETSSIQFKKRSCCMSPLFVPINPWCQGCHLNLKKLNLIYVTCYCNLNILGVYPVTYTRSGHVIVLRINGGGGGVEGRGVEVGTINTLKHVHAHYLCRDGVGKSHYCSAQTRDAYMIDVRSIDHNHWSM